ncbi:uncharacterized protein B0T23DRAFT_368528, partial [Neurospora hispaniola]
IPADTIVAIVAIVTQACMYAEAGTLCTLPLLSPAWHGSPRQSWWSSSRLAQIPHEQIPLYWTRDQTRPDRPVLYASCIFHPGYLAKPPIPANTGSAASVGRTLCAVCCKQASRLDLSGYLSMSVVRLVRLKAVPLKSGRSVETATSRKPKWILAMIMSCMIKCLLHPSRCTRRPVDPS